MNGYPVFFRPEPDPESPRVTRVPLSIYVMWHPALAEGPVLARDIHEWFGGVTRDARAVGLGIPVHFRSEPWRPSMALTAQEARRSEEAVRAAGERPVRRPINLGHADENVFVPLVDDNMVDDVSWRRDLLIIARECHAQAKIEQAGRRAERPLVHLLPVQVSPSWTRLPPEVTAFQALFLRRWTDDKDEPAVDRLSRWRLLLRRLLTQSLVRLLRERRSTDDGRCPTQETTLPTEVFLSHAKADEALGPGVAERLRDVAAGYGQIDVFYDENDLPTAALWARRLLGSAGRGAGFIAVLSDAYATRYWCRREVEQARTPHRVGETSVWAVRPTVVAVTLSKAWSRLIPDLSTVPAIAWNGDRAPEILDQLFREALIAEFQLLYARSLEESLNAALPKVVPRPEVAYLTWTPDAASVLRLHRAQREAWRGGATIAYPGHGFLPTEEKDIALSLGDEHRLVSYEQLADAVARLREKDHWRDALGPCVSDACAAPALATWPILALSAGDCDDLAARGYDGGVGSVHVDAAVLRFCRALFEGHVRIAYGGTLRDGPTFTSLLFDVVNALAAAMPLESEADPATPLESYVVAQNWKSFDVTKRASMVGLARFVRIGQEPAPNASPSTQAAMNATALSEMRRVIAARTRATLALGGKRYRFSGLLPGVAEEILCAMEQTVGPGDLARPRAEDVRVLLLGEYGGATAAIARYVLRHTPTIPEELTLGGQTARGLAVLADEAKCLEAAERYAALARCLDGLRAIADAPPHVLLPRLGLTVGQWRAVLGTASAGYVRRLIKERVVKALHGGAAA